MTILVTGGAGFVGSHASIGLIQAGHRVVIFDNFANARRDVAGRIERITGVPPTLVEGDVRDGDLLASTLREYRCEAVMHFAALKSIRQSIDQPLAYYETNVLGSLRLVQAMQEVGVGKLVFSSSAAVYGEPISVPLREDHPLAPQNPYARSKRDVEQMLEDIVRTASWLRIAILRYFNPAGAHPSGLIGENPLEPPDNIMPRIARVAAGRDPCLAVFGNDYETPDGTCMRDYVHVMDLAEGHLRALECLQTEKLITVNLGTGCGVSVLELIHAFSKGSGRKIPYRFSGRRPGDVASCFADPGLALRKLNWSARRSVADMCQDSWRWQSSEFPNVLEAVL
jgi:UDP-glucose 4-epimerase